jgi:hypothetical protein
VSAVVTCEVCRLAVMFYLFVVMSYEVSVNSITNPNPRARDSVVGIATGYGLDDRGVRIGVPVGSRVFSSPSRRDWLWGPPNLLSNGYRRALSPRIKRPGRKADHSPPTSAEVKKMWIYTSTPPYAFMA